MTELGLARNATETLVETFCRIMHDAYEKAALTEGWETQRASRVRWEDVPPANQATMRAAVRGLMASEEFRAYHNAAWWEGALDMQARISDVLREVNAEHRAQGLADYEKRQTN
jgi:hypothetical protein